MEKSLKSPVAYDRLGLVVQLGHLPCRADRRGASGANPE